MRLGPYYGIVEPGLPRKVAIRRSPNSFGTRTFELVDDGTQDARPPRGQRMRASRMDQLDDPMDVIGHNNPGI